MGSIGMGTETRKTLQLKIKRPEVENLRALGHMLKKTQRLNFTKKYGKILELLDVEVQVEAVSALAQFYDPQMRCFQFQDFQLAPTLEEFEQILGLPLKNEKPYHYLGHYPSLETIASVLKVHVKDLKTKEQNRNLTKGYPKKYLEEHMRNLAKLEDWDAFMDVLALTIYGILLFPSSDEFVDHAAIDVFMALKFRGENPVPAVLADVYYTLNFCHERNGKRILCCTSALYVWLTAHIFERKYKADCPILDHKWLQLKQLSSREWAQTLVELREKTVRWYPQWEEVKEVVCHCGSFPNVPLLGTRGCINYNPALSLRQLGYPMMSPPTDDAVSPFVLYDMGIEHSESIKRVRQAWGRVVRKSKELGVRSCGAKEGYRQWVRNRACDVKLPFRALTVRPEELPTPMDTEEMEEMKSKLAQSEKGKEELKAELREIRQAYEALRLEKVEKEHSLESANKRARSEQEYVLKTKDCLKAANKELGLRRQERDKALDENKHLKELLTNAKISQREHQKRSKELEKEIEEVVSECRDKIQNERLQREEMAKRCQLIINEKNEEIQDLMHQLEKKDEFISEERHETDFWKARFSRLVWIANGALEDVPRLMSMAEGMVNPLATPIEIVDFIDHCKNLVKQMKQLINSDQ